MTDIISRFCALPEDPIIMGVMIFLCIVILMLLIRKHVWKRQYKRLNDIREEEVRNGKTAVDKANRTIEQNREQAERRLRKIEDSIASAANDQRDMMAITAQRSADATAANEKAEAAEKRLSSLQNKYKRCKGLLDSAVASITRYAEGTLIESDGFLSQASTLQNEFASVEPVDLKALTIKDLRARFRQNALNIQELCQEYQNKYTTKVNATIYRLVVLALQEGVQNIYHGLSYNSLDAGIDKLRTLTTKCFEIAIEGNQTILSTLSRFIGQVEHLYVESIKIEYEYYVKRERAKEEQAAIREQIRQEREEHRLLEQQRKMVENEEQKYQNEISRLKEQVAITVEQETINSLMERLAEVEALLLQVEEKKEEIITLQHGKAGTIYVISNLGSFGENMFKIGMTRRIDPMDRVRELGDASVPFPFDVHSLIFSDDAVSLEYQLHRQLSRQRVNKINMRKEFFSVTVDELEELVTSVDPTAEFSRTMLAEQYHQSLSIKEAPDETSIDMLPDDENDQI